MKKNVLLCSAALLSLLVSSAAYAQNRTQVIRVDIPGPNFEICLGGAMAPKLTVRNVGGGLQHIRASIVIKNAVSGINIYSDHVNLSNIPAGKDTIVALKQIITDPNVLSQRGRHDVIGVASAIDGQGTWIGDDIPSDDTMRSLMFGLRGAVLPLHDGSNAYSVTNARAIPDPLHWISLGATIVEGDDHTFDPPSPRDPEIGYGSLGLHSPVIRLDRRNTLGQLYSGTSTGDTITSQYIDLEGVTKCTLQFDLHRSNKRLYSTGYDQDTLLGLESTVLNTLGAVVRRGDSLIVEFRDPNQNSCTSTVWRQVASVDGGKDMEFQTLRIPIESKNSASVNYFSKDFRYRLRLKAKSDATNVAVDDDDPWYIDNVSLERPVYPEVSLKWVRTVTPYTKVPASQALFRVYLKFAYHAQSLVGLPLIVQIEGPDNKTKYWQRLNVNLAGAGDTVIEFPSWDARNTLISQGRECKVRAWIDRSGYDLYEDDNEAYSSFYLNVAAGSSDQEFAYDDGGLSPGLHAGNDYPAITDRQGYGAGFSNTSGSYAMRFNLIRTDTLYGVRVYFARMNAAPDPISIAVHDGSPTSNTPGSVITSFTDERKGEQFDKFWSYFFSQPVVLKGSLNNDDGIYWISVKQLGLDAMMLGADISRMGSDTRISDILTPNMRYLHRSIYGTQYASDRNSGDITGRFALQTGGGSWHELTPQIMTGTPGAFIPMIRPLVSRRTLLPVEYAKPLAVSESDNTALLTWTTATETNNHGFVVQRRSGSDEWQRIGFVASRSANSSTPNGYSYVDQGLIAGTYTYRLTQVDLDGSESISNTAEVTIQHGDSRVSSFWPNPFEPASGVTSISVDPSIGDVKVTIVNALGQTVRSMVATGMISWDGKNEHGALVAGGSYLVRLQANGLDEVRQLSVMR